MPCRLASPAWCPSWDSNPDCADFEPVASANWTRGAWCATWDSNPEICLLRAAHLPILPVAHGVRGGDRIPKLQHLKLASLPIPLLGRWHQGPDSNRDSRFWRPQSCRLNDPDVGAWGRNRTCGVCPQGVAGLQPAAVATEPPTRCQRTWRKAEESNLYAPKVQQLSGLPSYHIAHAFRRGREGVN
jgi:hypothetical protein